jgi:hypothetical protein
VKLQKDFKTPALVVSSDKILSRGFPSYGYGPGANLRRVPIRLSPVKVLIKIGVFWNNISFASEASIGGSIPSDAYLLKGFNA